MSVISEESRFSNHFLPSVTSWTIAKHKQQQAPCATLGDLSMDHCDDDLAMWGALAPPSATQEGQQASR